MGILEGELTLHRDGSMVIKLKIRMIDKLLEAMTLGVRGMNAVRQLEEGAGAGVGVGAEIGGGVGEGAGAGAGRGGDAGVGVGAEAGIGTGGGTAGGAWSGAARGTTGMMGGGLRMPGPAGTTEFLLRSLQEAMRGLHGPGRVDLTVAHPLQLPQLLLLPQPLNQLLISVGQLAHPCCDTGLEYS